MRGNSKAVFRYLFDGYDGCDAFHGSEPGASGRPSKLEFWSEASTASRSAR